MPGFDRTGPRGRGPLTGWGRGWCIPASQAPATEERDEIPAAVPQEAEQTAAYRPQAGPVYGVGRGGFPRGCGRGFCGGRFRGRGRYW
jgi:hypothetical protein